MDIVIDLVIDIAILVKIVLFASVTRNRRSRLHLIGFGNNFDGLELRTFASFHILCKSSKFAMVWPLEDQTQSQLLRALAQSRNDISMITSGATKVLRLFH